MKKTIFFTATLLMSLSLFSQGYKIDDKAINFKLKNIDDQTVSLSDFDEAKGFIIIFTCNHCPYSVAYEDRIIELDKTYKKKGYPVIAINPNDPKAYPSDSFEKMKVRAKDKGFTFPYLYDETQEIAKTYGATKTPHVYIVQKQKKNFVVKYIGAIDDNYQDGSVAKTHFVAQSIDELLQDKAVSITTSKAIGCSIKWRK